MSFTVLGSTTINLAQVERYDWHYETAIKKVLITIFWNTGRKPTQFLVKPQNLVKFATIIKLN